MARKIETVHYHGHLHADWRPNPEPTPESFEAALHSLHEVLDWMAAQLREAKQKPDMELTDEQGVWAEMIRGRQTLITGLQGGPTIMAQAMPDGECWCERRSLRVAEKDAER